MNLCRQWFIYGKINESPPEGYDEEEHNQIMYDPDAKYGDPILGGVANNYDEKQLIDFWEMIKGFSKYLFNKSHAASYSYMTVLTAYFKTYYPKEFMAALLSWTEKEEVRAKYVIECKDHYKFVIALPDINYSGKYYTPIPKKKKIAYGLSFIKGIGDTALEEIIKNQPYRDIEDLVERTKANKTVVVALIKSGAFDNYVDTPRNITLLKYVMSREKENLKVIPYLRNSSDLTLYEYENETLGVSLSYIPTLKRAPRSKKDKIKIEARITKVKEHITKSGKKMCFVDIETLREHEVVSTSVFDAYLKNRHLFKVGSYVTAIIEKGEFKGDDSYVIQAVKTFDPLKLLGTIDY